MSPFPPRRRCEHSRRCSHCPCAHTDTCTWQTPSRVVCFTRRSHPARVTLLLPFLALSIIAACVAKDTDPVCSFPSVVTPQVTWPFPAWWDVRCFGTASRCRCCPLSCARLLSFLWGTFSNWGGSKCVSTFNCHRHYYTIFPKRSSDPVSCSF